MKRIFSLLIVASFVFNISCQQGAEQTETTTNNPTETPAATNNNATPAQPAAPAATTAAQKPAAATKTSQNTPLTVEAAPKGAVNWITLEEVQEKAKTDPRKVIVDLYTDWCGWCKRMDKATFQHPDVAKYINENFYAVKFNAETKENVNFKEKDYKFVPRGRKGTNELTYKFVLGDKPTGRVGYPTIAFLDEKLDRIDAYAGYKDAHNFDELMHYVQEGKDKNLTLAAFQQTYDSPIPATPARGSNRNSIRVNPKQIKAQNGANNIKVKKNINNSNIKVRKVDTK